MDVHLVTFGEPLIRLSVPRGIPMAHTRSFDAYVGGSELNVAIAANYLGVSCKFVSKAPAKGPGQMVAATARAHGVDASDIIISKDSRMGLYFHDFGASQRPASVTYDRFPSAFQSITPDEVDWERILSGARVFHSSGITAALGVGALGTLQAGVEAAKRMGVTVSFDVNYRSALWSPTACSQALAPILKMVDVLFTSMGDLRTVLGVNAPSLASALPDLAALGIPIIAGVYNDPDFRGAPWIAQAFVRGEIITEQRDFTVDTVDRIGAGDAFAAGFLKGYLDGDIESALRYGTAMMALKNSMLGDYCWATMDDVDEFLLGSAAMVKR